MQPQPSQYAAMGHQERLVRAATDTIPSTVRKVATDTVPTVVTTIAETSVAATKKTVDTVAQGLEKGQKLARRSSVSVWDFVLPTGCRHTKLILGERERKEKHRKRQAALRASSELSEIRALIIGIESDEYEERELIEAVANEIFVGLTDAYRTEAATVKRDTVWDGGSTSMNPTQLKNTILFFIHQMRCRLRSEFSTLFPDGVDGTNLTAPDVATCVAAQLIIDMSLCDESMDSFAFTIIPGRRVSLENCPEEKRYLFFTFMAFKSTVSHFAKSVPAFRQCVLDMYQNPDIAVAPEFQLPLMALKNAVRYIAVHPVFIAETRMFYTEALALEEELHMSRGNEDMTISVGFQKCDEVGRGAHGVVYSCVNTANGKFMALKQIKLTTNMGEASVRGEINMLKRVRHENVIRYFGCAIDRPHGVVSILMEFARKSLRSIIEECGGLSEPLTLRYARCILEGLAYLHDQHIIHRDIKAANILVSERGEVKVSDFGMAMLCENEVNNDDGDGSRVIQGTPLFLAPELIHGARPSQATDMWAFGCTLIEMVSGLTPWWELMDNDEHLPLEVLCYRIGTAKEPPKLPDQLQMDPRLRELIMSCLELDPCARPTARQLLANPLLDQNAGSGGRHPHGTPIAGWATPATPSTAPNTARGTHPGMSSISRYSEPQSSPRPGMQRGEVGSMWADDFAQSANISVPAHLRHTGDSNSLGSLQEDLSLLSPGARSDTDFGDVLDDEDSAMVVVAPLSLSTFSSQVVESATSSL